MANMQIVPAASFKKNIVEAQYVEMMVPLYSYGCDKKIKKSLSYIKGIYSVTVDYGQQKVTVWGICNKYDVLETVRSKRKEARFWNPEDNVVPDQTEDPELPEMDPPKPKRSNSVSLSKAGRSLSWKKAWKKLVFTRSNSF